jgi:CDP-glycerol glycerophosphotransferase (TagB/SpsB family)
LIITLTNVNIRPNEAEIAGYVIFASQTEKENTKIFIEDNKGERIFPINLLSDIVADLEESVDSKNLSAFKFIIAQAYIEATTSLRIIAEQDENVIIPQTLRFHGKYVALSDDFAGAWAPIGRHMISFNRKKQCFTISKRNFIRIFTSEIHLIISVAALLIRTKDIRIFLLPCLMLVRAYAIIAEAIKPSKSACLFIDRIDEADENAEALYHYAEEQSGNKGKNYIVVTSKSADYKRLKMGKHRVVRYRSAKHLRVLLRAKNLITSFGEPSKLAPFWVIFRRFLNDRINYNHILVKHGVDKENLSWYENYLLVNERLWAGVSPRECEFVMAHYNLSKREVVNSGLPRYDNLDTSGARSKKILVMPTWHEDLVGNIKGGKRLYSEAFVESEFFKNWNALLNDEALKQILKQYDYKLVFRPHKNIIAQLDDFEKNEVVIFDYDTPLSRLKNETDALLTDYSSIFFDFAYMNKPVYYYQFVDYHRDRGESYFSYEEDGFGPVYLRRDEIIGAIEKGLELDLSNDMLYFTRAQKFFTHIDKNNCKRMWDEIVKL